MKGEWRDGKMGHMKDKLNEEMDRANHLDRCMKCNKVLRTYEERDILMCDDCVQKAIEED